MSRAEPGGLRDVHALVRKSVAYAPVDRAFGRDVAAIDDVVAGDALLAAAGAVA